MVASSTPNTSEPRRARSSASSLSRRLVAFAGLVTWVALYQNASLEAAPVPGRVVLGAPSIPGSSLAGLAGGASAGVLLLTAIGILAIAVVLRFS